MKKCIVISDSFKGTLTSREICSIARESTVSIFPACQVLTIPVADGGEGTVACYEEACGGRRIKCRVSGPLGETVDAAYLQLEDGSAVIEMASAAGLPLIGEKKDPCRATTYGVGEEILAAIESGCRKIILGLGGSATNDGGCGCAAALGVRFLNAEGCAFVPTGATLDQIVTIDVSGAEKTLDGVSVVAMCDIDNPLYGPEGAACMFAPQKGADADTVAFLDGQLRRLDQAIQRNLHRETAQMPGAGAAGGFGAGAVAFLGAHLRSGIETILDTVGFDELLRDCDVVFTGEGCIDEQSVHGKAVSGIAGRARARHVPVVAVAGGITAEAERRCAEENTGISALFSTIRLPGTMQDIVPHSAAFYRAAFDNILRLIAVAERFK
ncbi:MAG: glycerate kinase [Clostridiales bacterium]|nr:glycerate kinase [Clostridiales bacterium]